MSSNLYMIPKPVLKTTVLPDALKFILRKKYDLNKQASFTSEDYQYLSGLRDSGVEGANELISEINRHGCVLVFEES